MRDNQGGFASTNDNASLHAGTGPARGAAKSADAAALTTRRVVDPGFPKAAGLYDPANEHDSCGVGFVASMHNHKTHEIVQHGLSILKNLEHRGAVGADPKAGDGCGLLLQMPHEFFAAVAPEAGIDLPAAGDYAVGHIFMPRDPAARAEIEALVAELSA